MPGHIHAVKEPTNGHFEVGEPCEAGIDAVCGGLDGSSPGQNGVGFNLDPRARAFNAGNRIGNRHRISRRHSWGCLANLLKLFVSHIHVAHQDIPDPEPFDHLHGLPFGALPDREHRDDRTDPENHAEHGQHGAQLVSREVFDGGAECIAQGHDPPPGRTGPVDSRFSSLGSSAVVGSRNATRSPSSSPETTTTLPKAAGPSSTSAATNFPRCQR